jgi:hypothetical protein
LRDGDSAMGIRSRCFLRLIEMMELIGAGWMTVEDVRAPRDILEAMVAPNVISDDELE